MQIRNITPALAVIATLAGCGGDDPASSGTSDVAIRFSDAPVDGATKVVVTVDKISFEHDDETTVVDTFADGAETFTIDLLEVQGEKNRLVLDSVELKVGKYSDLRLDIINEDANMSSYVEEFAGSDLKPIKVPSGELKLGGFEVLPESSQTFVIEFGLRQSMTYNPGPDRYILKPRGVRIVALEQAATIAGTVDLTALHLEEPCDQVAIGAGDAVYLYAGERLPLGALADDFDPSVDGSADEARVAPIASSLLADDGAFVFAYLEPGDYTVAASCMAGADDSELDDGFVIPQPSNQRVETRVERGERSVCMLGGALATGDAPTCAIAAASESDVVDESDEAKEIEAPGTAE